MNRRTFVSSLGAAALPGAAPSRPNVILLITDDQGFGDLACHGNPSIQTPALDSLHSRSTRFTNFHVSPTCAPTRAALLTGRYSNATGVWHTIMGRSLLRPGETTLAQCFRASGYRTAIFGKWHLGDNYPCRPQDRGFDETLIHGGGGVWQTPDHFGNDYFDDTYLHNGKPRQFKGHCTDVWFDNARGFIAGTASQRKPFFCYLATNAPHSPMWSPDSYAAPYARTRGLRDPGFYGMITHIDSHVARLAAFLDERNLTENTIFIYMTDNGTAAGAQVHNAGMRGNKGSPYEGGHRVPFWISWPGGGIKPGRDINALAAHVDVLPTLVDLCGLNRPAGRELHGQSLTPLLAPAPASWPDRTLVVDSQREENLVKWRQAAVMTQQWRLVNPSADGSPDRLELYDIAKDPGQRSNVAADHPQVVSRLRAEYDAWWSKVSIGADQPVRIVVGHPAENPTRLTAHDWHGEGAEKVWNQAAIRKAPVANGAWTLHVHRAGKYHFELRRWPAELNLPINAPYQDPHENREKTPGAAISAVQARIRLGSLTRSTSITGTEPFAAFELQLKSGPADLETAFIDASGAERGAYYVYVTRL
jgi:arylsulfatase B